MTTATTNRLDVAASADLPAIGGGVCPHCAAPVGDGDKICGACGKRVDVKACAKCEAEIAPGVMFCTSCGAPRDSEGLYDDDDESPAERIAKREAKLGGAAPPPSLSASPKPDAADAVPPEVARALEAAPVARGMFTPRQLRMVYEGVFAELTRRGWPPVGDDAKQECADTMCEVLNFYVHIDEKYSLAVRCVIAHVTAFAPGVIVKLIETRRKARGEDANGFAVASKPANDSRPLRVVKETDGVKTVDGGGAPGEFPPPPREDD